MRIKLYWTILTVIMLLRNKGFAMDKFYQRTNAILSSSTTLECISSPLTDEVTISDPLGNKVVSCPFDECFCTEPEYSCTKNMSASSTSVNISYLTKTDSGLWTCTHGFTSSTVNMIVLTVPSSVYEDKVVADFVPSKTPKTMTAKIECAYPAANIEWEFVNSEDNSSASTVSPIIKDCVDNGVSGEPCTDAAAKTFTCFFDVSTSTASSLLPGTYRVKASLVMEGEVNSTGLFTVLSTVITVPGPPPNYDSPVATAALVLATCNIAIVICLFFTLSRALDCKSETSKKILFMILSLVFAADIISISLAAVCLSQDCCDKNCVLSLSALLLGVMSYAMKTTAIYVILSHNRIQGCGPKRLKLDRPETKTAEPQKQSPKPKRGLTRRKEYVYQPKRLQDHLEKTRGV